MVVAGTTQVGVVARQQRQVRLGQRQALEALAQDRLEAPVATGAEAECTLAGRLQALLAMRLAQAQDAQAGPVAEGRMDAPLEDVADHPGRMGAGMFRPAHQALRRPLGMLAMALGHVLGLRAVPPFLLGAHMAGDPLVAVDALHGTRRQAHLQLLFHLIGHRVVMPVDLDVVVDVHPVLLPLGIDVGLLRQLPERSPVESLQQHGNGRVEFVQREELAVPQGVDDPERHHLYADWTRRVPLTCAKPRRAISGTFA